MREQPENIPTHALHDDLNPRPATTSRRDFITSPNPTREWLQCWGRIDAQWRNEKNNKLIFSYND